MYLENRNYGGVDKLTHKIVGCKNRYISQACFRCEHEPRDGDCEYEVSVMNLELVYSKKEG